MNCNDVRENLIDVLAEGQTAPEVLAHLRQCNACTQELEGLRSTMALMDEWEAPEPSPYFLTRLQAHVREERQKEPVRSSIFAWLRKPVMAASLAAALIVGGVTYRYVMPMIDGNPPSADTAAVTDVESLDKNADLIVNSDLIDEMSGGPSDDVAEP
jgi:anti-sigma factor RsiW